MNGKAHCSVWFLALVQSSPTMSCSLKIRKEQQRQNLHHKQPHSLCALLFLRCRYVVLGILCLRLSASTITLQDRPEIEKKKNKEAAIVWRHGSKILEMG